MPARKKTATAEVSATLIPTEPKKTVKEANQISALEQLRSEVGQQINTLPDLGHLVSQSS